jgi:lipoyl(octanoyl) transferase
VFTAGKRTEPHERPLLDDGTPVVDVDRGGKITFHGPGQLVGYPILDLGPKPDAAAHLRRMEEAVIRTGADLGVPLERREDVQTGVWHGDEKMCAIGVRLLRARVTIHGFAVNCEPDLSWFDGIVACGLPGRGVTSLSRLAGRPITVDEVAPLLERHLADVFDLAFATAPDAIADELRPVTV